MNLHDFNEACFEVLRPSLFQKCMSLIMAINSDNMGLGRGVMQHTHVYIYYEYTVYMIYVHVHRKLFFFQIFGCLLQVSAHFCLEQHWQQIRGLLQVLPVGGQRLHLGMYGI